MRKLHLSAVAILGAFAASCSPAGEKVGDFSNDWTGNEFQVTAVRDPAIPEVVCHFATYDRGFLDRIGKGNWFESPSNSAIDCHATAPINEAALAHLSKNTEIASQGASLLFKRLAVRRIIDMQNRSLVYLSYSREITNGSAKIGMTVVPFGNAPSASVRQAPAAGR